MAAASFAALPMELVEEIIGWLPVSGQATVSLVSRRFYSIAMSFMYRNNRRHDGSSALRESVILANIKGIERALEQGLDVNASGEDGRTALHHAVMYRNGCTYGPGSPLERILQLLLDSGANPTAKEASRYQASPFHFACQKENYAAALFFLQKQAAGEIDLKLNADAINRALREVVQPLGHWDTCGVSHEIRDVYVQNIEYLRKNHRELVRQLLGMKGVRVNDHSSVGFCHAAGPGGMLDYNDVTLLHSALIPRRNHFIRVIKPDIEVVRLLLEAGARPNATTRDHSSWTTLNLVVKLVTRGLGPSEKELVDLVDLVELLVAYGARLDTVGGRVRFGAPDRTYPFFHAIYQAFWHCGWTNDFSKLMAIIKAMLDCNGRTRILPKGHMSRAADMLVELCEKDNDEIMVLAAWECRHDGETTALRKAMADAPTPIELLRLLSDYGCESKRLDLSLKNWEDSSEEGESDSDDEDEDKNEERPSKPPRVNEVTGGGQEPKTTRSGRRYG
ncbi:ankyrin repeat-containing domain protein [Rhypophila decipiens]|uniref:Ankyrin repeat-containing domain protein n=1 Tax=Rhypophila decipiens TaxID=261697 RepID=A0AAN6Y561_9PEZI|nr:ankyrin repeat-containing domain protein [Rhypophila decipiens]